MVTEQRKSGDKVAKSRFPRRNETPRFGFLRPWLHIAGRYYIIYHQGLGEGRRHLGSELPMSEVRAQMGGAGYHARGPLAHGISLI